MNYESYKEAAPRYFQLKMELLEEIEKLKAQSGSLFYSQRQIMEKYNVSHTTVNKALDELIRNGILTRIQGKGTYITSAEITNPKKQINQNIGVFLPRLGKRLSETESPTHYSIFHGICRKAEECGYILTVLGQKNSNINIDKIKKSNVDGIIIIGAQTPVSGKLAYELKQNNITSLLLDRHEQSEDINYIEQYSEREISRAVKYLLGLEHKRIAGIGVPPDLYIYRNFYSAFQKTMQNANAFDPKLIAYAKKNTKKEFKIILENLFSQKNKPSAIFLFNESCIQNFMDALSALKIRIPKDVSLLVTASKQPTIKGIKLATFGGISPVERGEEAAKTLIGMIEGKIAQPVNIKLKLNILEGESCRKLK